MTKQATARNSADDAKSAADEARKAATNAANDVKNQAADAGDEAAEPTVVGSKEATAKAVSRTADTQTSLGENIEKATRQMQGLSAFNQQNLEALTRSSEITAKALQSIGMVNFSNSFNAMQSLIRFATAYQAMTTAAGEVFFRRSLMMASGSMSAPAALNMVAEKATTFAEAAGEATAALVKGEDPLGVASAALAPYGTRTAANVRELRG